MRYFDAIDRNQIKALQKLLLEKTADLDDTVRARVYNAFNDVHYKYITSADARERFVTDAQAFFSPAEKTVFLVQNRFDSFLHAVLHETIHSVTNADTLHLGFKSVFLRLDAEGRVKAKMISNDALNEAATEFYATTFLHDEKNCSYQHLVQIYKYLSDTCGYEKLKNCYFACDIKKFKQVVANSFKLPNTELVDRLILQMEALKNVGASKIGNRQVMLLVDCYLTLVQMNYHKLKHEMNDLKGLNEKNLFAMIDIDTLTTSMKNASKFALQLNDILYSELNYKVERMNNILSIESFSKHVTEEQIEVLAQTVMSCQTLQKHHDFIKHNLPDVLLQLCKKPRFYDDKRNIVEADQIFNAVLNVIKDKNGKLDLSALSKMDKERAMSLILYGPLKAEEKPYRIF